MSLPSSRRPPSLVEEGLEQASKKMLTITVDKKKIFMDTMITWYKEQLTDRNKGRLTPTKLKRKAVHVLFKLKFPYTHLPLDWVKQLADATGMKLYAKRKKNKEPQFADKGVSVIADPMITRHPANLFPTAESPHSVAESKEESTSKAIKMQGSDKPFIDLTKLPPPPEWLEAYAKGEHRRREITFHFGTQRNMVFWDYNPQYKEKFMSTLKQPVHLENSFNWFADSVPKSGQPPGKKKDDDDD